MVKGMKHVLFEGFLCICVDALVCEWVYVINRKNHLRYPEITHVASTMSA